MLISLSALVALVGFSACKKDNEGIKKNESSISF